MIIWCLASGVLLIGRLLCDTYLSARELVKEVDYTLATLSRNLLNQERQDLAAADVPGKHLDPAPTQLIMSQIVSYHYLWLLSALLLITTNM